MTVESVAKERLEYLRGEIKAERISYGELAELQSLREFIDASDVDLLQWAGPKPHHFRLTIDVAVGIPVESDATEDVIDELKLLGEKLTEHTETFVDAESIGVTVDALSFQVEEVTSTPECEDRKEPTTI